MAGSERITSVDCGCVLLFDLTKDHHDWLYRLANSASSGDMICLVELLQYIDSTADEEREPFTLSWQNFPAWVAMHRWDNQAAFYWLAQHLELHITWRLRTVRS